MDIPKDRCRLHVCHLAWAFVALRVRARLPVKLAHGRLCCSHLRNVLGVGTQQAGGTAAARRKAPRGEYEVSRRYLRTEQRAKRNALAIDERTYPLR